MQKEMLKIEIIGNGNYAIIKELNPASKSEQIIDKTTVLAALEAKGVVFGINEEIIEYYLKKVEFDDKPVKDVIIAARNNPIDAGMEYVKLNFEADYFFDDIVIWKMFNDYFSNFDLMNYYNFPYKVKFFHKGEIIAHLVKSGKQQVGTNVFGKKITSKQVQIDIYAGENVFFDERRNAFVAGASGFLNVNDGTITIIRPYFISEDKMKLYFLNIPLMDSYEVNNEDILAFCNERGIIRNILPRKLKDPDCNSHILVLQGTQTTQGRDAKIDIYYSTEKSVGKVDETGKIDFKEKDNFFNAEEGDVLVVKTHPVEGKPGKNIFDVTINPKPVKDINFRAGPGTRKHEEEDKFTIYSNIDGILEFDKSYVSVSPIVYIMGDVDYSCGNIDTKANVEIKGSVKGGFNVISSRDITIKGDVEDNCQIIAKGNIKIGGGVHGEKTYIQSGGKISTKFVEFSKIKAKDQINILKFLMGADIECGDNVIIFGQEINLDTRGALVESTVKVKKMLICPVIGNKNGSANHISFGYDKALENNIKNSRETIYGLKSQIDEIIAEAAEYIDIERPNLTNEMNHLALSIKKIVIGYIQDKKNLEKKLSLIQKMYENSLQKRDKIIKESKIKVDRRIFPKLVLQCKGITKTYDHKMLNSEFYFSFKEMDIKFK